MAGQITMSIEGALLELSHRLSECTLHPGSEFVLPLRVTRSPKLTKNVRLELTVPSELRDLICAEPIDVPPDRSTAELRIMTKSDRRLIGTWSIAARASALYAGHPVVSETSFQIEFVAGHPSR